MESWSLKRFVKEFDYKTVAIIWGVTHQAVYRAMKEGRDVRIVLTEGSYHVWEDKLLGCITEKKLKALRSINQG